jgi:hypothetical protein
VGNMQFVVLGMPPNFGVISIPFLHIGPNILVNLHTTCMLTKKIPLRSKQHIFPFHLTTNPTLDIMHATM